MLTLWNREPALILGALQSLLALALAFGAKLTTQQQGALLAAAAALLALVTRQLVSPAIKGEK